MEAVHNILYGVISGVIAAILFELLSTNSKWFPSPSEPPENVLAEIPKPDDSRSENRQKLNLVLFNMFFYFYTFFVTYVAILLPPVLKSTFSETPLLLSEARIIGDYLPQIAIGSDFVQTWVIATTVVIYVPLLFIVDILSNPIAHIVKKFKVITLYRWRAIQGLVFIGFALMLAVFSIYLFNNGTIKDQMT